MANPQQSLVLNCGYGRGFSVNEVLDAVDRVSGVTLKRHVEPRRPGDPDALVADNRQILDLLPWQPKYQNLETIVAHALAWERQLHQRRN